MELLNISKITITVKLADGTEAYLLPRQRLSGIADESYEKVSQFVRILSYESGRIQVKKPKSKTTIVEEVIDYEEDKEIKIIEKPKKRKRRKKKTNG